MFIYLSSGNSILWVYSKEIFLNTDHNKSLHEIRCFCNTLISAQRSLLISSLCYLDINQSFQQWLKLTSSWNHPQHHNLENINNTGIKIARRNVINLRYADDTTLMAESEEELKSLLMKLKEESEKIGLKLNIQNGIWSHHFMANRWGNSGNSVRLYFWELQNHCRWWLQPWN